MKKIISLLIIIIILAIIAIFVAGRFFRVTVFQSVPILGKINCSYPVAVGGDSMAPALKSGTRTVFNQCIEQNDNLPSGTIVLFKDGSVARISRIQENHSKEGKVFYSVRQDNRKEIMEIAADKIVAIQ